MVERQSRLGLKARIRFPPTGSSRDGCSSEKNVSSILSSLLIHTHGGFMARKRQYDEECFPRTNQQTAQRFPIRNQRQTW